MRQHFFIGLGGQGGRTLAELRRVMAQRAGDVTALGQRGTHWQFLYIDSSDDVRNDLKLWRHFGNDVSLKNANEWLHLEPIQQYDLESLALRPDVSTWVGDLSYLRSFLEGGSISGANQRRRFGRLLYAKNANRIRDRIIEKVAAFPASECVFHLFCSVGGGTGSGGIIDLITAIRTEYPEANLERFPVFLHIYATHEEADRKKADIGYFQQNQFSTIRDLNALICQQAQPTISVQMLGDGYSAGEIFRGGEPIGQLVISSSLNRNNRRISIENQIRIVAEACFERIYAFGTGQMDQALQQSVTGQDVVANWGGEPLQNAERSYRFSGFGMRRWEVPHEKLSELLALSLLASSLRQMLYNNWDNKKGYEKTLPPADAKETARRIAELEEIVEAHLLANRDLPKLTVELRDELHSVSTSLLDKKIGGQPNPGMLEDTLKIYFRETFRGDGAATHLQKLQSAQSATVDGVVDNLDQALTDFWVNAASPVGLLRIPTLVEGLDGVLRARLAKRVNLEATNQRLNKSLVARRDEWEKLTFLSSAVGKRAALFRAHTDDVIALQVNELNRLCDEADAAYLEDVLGKLSRLKADYSLARTKLEEWLDAADRECRLIQGELENMGNGDGANKYELNPENLALFLPKMAAHAQHQRDSAQHLRQILREHFGTKPISGFRVQKPIALVDLQEKLQQASMERASAVHTLMQENGEVPRILEDSLLDLLESRLATPDAIRQEVAAFVAQAVSTLHIRSDPSPKVLLGANAGVPEPMPRRVLLMGLPNDNVPFATKLRATFLSTQVDGVRCDTYQHDDPTQVRLLFVDYWMAARFATVAFELSKKFVFSSSDDKAHAAFFCNIDDDGQANKRPNLFLPSPKELRDRFEAEFWLASRQELNVVQVGENGVYLIRQATNGDVLTENMGSDKTNALTKANEHSMHSLHAALVAALRKQPERGQALVADLLKKETERIEGSPKDLTTPEFQHWSKNLKPHLAGFAS